MRDYQDYWEKEGEGKVMTDKLTELSLTLKNEKEALQQLQREYRSGASAARSGTKNIYNGKG